MQAQALWTPRGPVQLGLTAVGPLLHILTGATHLDVVNFTP